jgi:hypothetical protein
MLPRSARTRGFRQHVAVLGDGSRFAGQRRLYRLQVLGAEQAQVGRNLVAGGQQHHVAGYQFAVDASRCLQPPRRTVTSLLTERASAASASSARPSWMKPITALIRVTPKITPESTHSPRKAVTTPASEQHQNQGLHELQGKAQQRPLARLRRDPVLAVYARGG